MVALSDLLFNLEDVISMFPETSDFSFVSADNILLFYLMDPEFIPRELKLRK